MDQLYDTEPGQPRVPLRATPEGYLLVQIAGGGGGGGSSVTNLTTTVSPTNVVVTSDTGTDATIPLADVTNAGAMPPAAVTQLAGLGTASEADVGDFAAADHTHALLMTTDERTKLGALPAAADLTTSLAGKMANTLPAMQAVYDGGTTPQKAAFQASVSEGVIARVPSPVVPTIGVIGDSIAQNQYGDTNLGGMFVRNLQPQFAWCMWGAYKSGGIARPDPYAFEGYSGKASAQILAAALGPAATVNGGRQIYLSGNCSISSGSPVVTTSGTVAQAGAGMVVSGVGIPAGATVITVDSSTQITMSVAATVTHASATVTLNDKRLSGIQACKPTFTLVIAGTNDINTATYAELTSGVALARCIAALRAMWAYVRKCGSNPIAVSLFPGNGTYRVDSVGNTTATMTELRAHKPTWNAAIKAAAAGDGVAYLDVYTVCGNLDGSWKDGYIQGSYAGGAQNGNLAKEDPFGIHPGTPSMLPLGDALGSLLKTLVGSAPGIPRLYPGSSPIYSAPFVADARGGFANFSSGLLSGTLTNISFDNNPDGNGVAAIYTPTLDIAGTPTLLISKPAKATASIARCQIGTPLTVVPNQKYEFSADVQAVQSDPNVTMALSISDGTSGATLNQPIAQFVYTGGQSRDPIDTGLVRVTLPFTVPSGVTSIKCYATVQPIGGSVVGGIDKLYVTNMPNFRTA